MSNWSHYFQVIQQLFLFKLIVISIWDYVFISSRSQKSHRAVHEHPFPSIYCLYKVRPLDVSIAEESGCEEWAPGSKLLLKCFLATRGAFTIFMSVRCVFVAAFKRCLSASNCGFFVFGPYRKQLFLKAWKLWKWTFSTSLLSFPALQACNKEFKRMGLFIRTFRCKH